MCAASVPSSDSSKIVVIKLLGEDYRMNANNIYMGACSEDNFHSPEKLNEALERPLPLKSYGDESAEMKDNYWENGDLIGTLPSEDLHRNGLSKYSILLYKSGPNPSKNCHAVVKPSILSQTVGLLPTGSGHVNTRPNQSVLTSVPKVQSLDPVWLQILSILSGSSDIKMVSESGNPVKPGSQTVLVSHISKPCSALASGTESPGSQEPSAVRMVVPTKIPMSGITNKFTGKQNLDNCKAADITKGELFMMSPTTTIIQDCPKVSHTVIRVVSQPGYLPAFIDKTNLRPHTDAGQHMELISNGEGSQMVIPLKMDYIEDESLNHHTDTISMSELSLPPLDSFPESGHKRCGGMIRESHNLKERKRRVRIKNACNLMRQLVPGMSHKTDKATVFEFSARYIYFLKSFVGSGSDKDFLLKYNPY